MVKKILKAAVGRRRGPVSRALALALIALGAMIVANIHQSLRPGEIFSGSGHAADGDSLILDGRRVRLMGIDAPELDQTCRDAVSTMPCGRRAQAELEQLVAGRIVECEASGSDRYDRTLARCQAGGKDLGSAMVDAGWAIAYGDYEIEERTARRAGAGIWAGTFVEPADWRAQHGQAARDFRFWQGWF